MGHRNGGGRKAPVQCVDPSEPRDTRRSCRRERTRLPVSVTDDVDGMSLCCTSPRSTSDAASSSELLSSAASHMSSVYDEMLYVADSLHKLQTCVAVGIVPLETRLIAFIIHDIGLLLCAPYCHAKTGAANVGLAVQGCTLKTPSRYFHSCIFHPLQF